MLSPPTGILRRESTGSLSPEDNFFHSAQDKEDDEGFDTDLEMEGKINFDYGRDLLSSKLKYIRFRVTNDESETN